MIIRYKDKSKELSKHHDVPYADTIALFQQIQQAEAISFQALQVLKCGYARHTGIYEYFTLQDISGAFNISEKEAEHLMKKSLDCLQVTFPNWMK